MPFVESAPRRSAVAAADGLVIRAGDGAVDDAPDDHARRAYRARLEDLRAELDEVERFADAGRAERLRVKMEHLVAELATHLSETVRMGTVCVYAPRECVAWDVRLAS